MKPSTGRLALTAILTSLLTTGCPLHRSAEKPAESFQDLPVGQILQRVAPATDRTGWSSGGGGCTTSREGTHAINHCEYAIDIGLTPAAASRFTSRLCSEILKELRKGGGAVGEGGDNEKCSFYLAQNGLHTWITVPPYANRGSRYRQMVVVDAW